MRFKWANGECRFGDKCNFAHGEQELRRLSGSFAIKCKSEAANQYSLGAQNCFNMDEKANISNFNNFNPVHGPNGWTEYHDPVTGDQYYHNYNTNVTQRARSGNDLWNGQVRSYHFQFDMY